jgi:hypothetical protein
LQRNLNSEEKYSHEVLSVNECASTTDGLHPIALIWPLKYTTENVEDLLIFWQTLQLPSSGLLILWTFGISCTDMAVGRGWKVASNRGDHVVVKRQFKDFFLRCDGHQEG